MVEYCLKAPWPTFETAEKMLNHTATRYSSLQIHEALARLSTFYSLHGLEHFKYIQSLDSFHSLYCVYCKIHTLWYVCHVYHCVIILLWNPQWHCLDWVSEQHWQFRRHPDPPEGSGLTGCTAPLAEIWGDENKDMMKKFDSLIPMIPSSRFSNRDRLLQSLMRAGSRLC